MLRLLIGTGVLLMSVGFGAAGWQYWQSLPKSAPADPVAAAVAAPAPSRQTWLISPTGGLVPQEEVQTYLAQERFVPGRRLRLEREANLADLLAEGEKLPEPAFLEVLADIRAPKVAEGLCGVLASVAQDCAVNRARVVEGSVDQARGTARFQLELVYRLKDESELPDLAAHVLRSDLVRLDMDPAAEGSSSAEMAVGALLDQVAAACSAETVGEICRPMELSVVWAPGQPAQGRARIAWLDPLPEGMFVAPPLDAATGD